MMKRLFVALPWQRGYLEQSRLRAEGVTHEKVGVVGCSPSNGARARFAACTAGRTRPERTLRLFRWVHGNLELGGVVSRGSHMSEWPLKALLDTILLRSN